MSEVEIYSGKSYGKLNSVISICLIMLLLLSVMQFSFFYLVFSILLVFLAVIGFCIKSNYESLMFSIVLILLVIPITLVGLNTYYVTTMWEKYKIAHNIPIETNILDFGNTDDYIKWLFTSEANYEGYVSSFTVFILLVIFLLAMISMIVSSVRIQRWKKKWRKSHEKYLQERANSLFNTTQQENSRKMAYDNVPPIPPVNINIVTPMDTQNKISTTTENPSVNIFNTSTIDPLQKDAVTIELTEKKQSKPLVTKNEI